MLINNTNMNMHLLNDLVPVSSTVSRSVGEWDTDAKNIRNELSSASTEALKWVVAQHFSLKGSRFSKFLVLRSQIYNVSQFDRKHFKLGFETSFRKMLTLVCFYCQNKKIDYIIILIVWRVSVHEGHFIDDANIFKTLYVVAREGWAAPMNRLPGDVRRSHFAWQHVLD